MLAISHASPRGRPNTPIGNLNGHSLTIVPDNAGFMEKKISKEFDDSNLTGDESALKCGKIFFLLV